MKNAFDLFPQPGTHLEACFPVAFPDGEKSNFFAPVVVVFRFLLDRVWGGVVVPRSWATFQYGVGLCIKFVSFSLSSMAACRRVFRRVIIFPTFSLLTLVVLLIVAGNVCLLDADATLLFDIRRAKGMIFVELFCSQGGRMKLRFLVRYETLSFVTLPCKKSR